MSVVRFRGAGKGYMTLLSAAVTSCVPSLKMVTLKTGGVEKATQVSVGMADTF